METVSAAVEMLDEKHFITISLGDDLVRIPLSDDNAIAVKAAFNKIIARIKLGEFQIRLEPLGEDLFSQVASEYLVQLNREIRSGSAKLNSGISGNSGHHAGLLTVWQAGVRDEISEEADSGTQAASQVKRRVQSESRVSRAA